VEYLVEGDLFLCSQAFIAEGAYYRMNRLEFPVTIALLEEFSMTPAALLDSIREHKKIFINNVRIDYVARESVRLMQQYLKTGECETVTLVGKNIEFMH